MVSVMTRQDDYVNNEDEAQRSEHTEKIPVPVPNHKDTDEEQPTEDNDALIPFDIPRRWYFY